MTKPQVHSQNLSELLKKNSEILFWWRLLVVHSSPLTNRMKILEKMQERIRLCHFFFLQVLIWESIAPEKFEGEAIFSFLLRVSWDDDK